MKKIIYLFAFCTALFCQNTFALSFTEALDNLSTYEKEIVRASSLKKQRITEIRQALIEIQKESDIELNELDSDIKTKRERLTVLLEQPEPAEDGTSENVVVTDEILLSNIEELKLNLIVLGTEQKKATLVNVYANDLLAQLSEATTQQSQKLLFNKAPSLLKLSNWQTAYTSIPGMLKSISADILIWVITVIVVGFALIFGLGPILFRQYKSSYKTFMSIDHYHRWSFLLIFGLVLISNCLYFVFVSQNKYLELTFIILMFFNLSLAIILLKRLNDVEFVPLRVVIDGEPVQKDRQLFVTFILFIKLLVIASAIASVFGYIVLSMYTLHNVVITLTAMVLFLNLRCVWINSESKFANSSDEEKPKQSMFMLTIVELVLAIGLFLTAARFWGISLNNFEG